MRTAQIIILLFFITSISLAQERRDKNRLKEIQKSENAKLGDSTNRRGGKSKRVAKNDEATIDMYKIISRENDTIHLDTTLTIQKEYTYNYLRKDNFDLIPFSNIGQTYTTLSYNFRDNQLMPGFTAQARQFNFKELNDVYYYSVPTPLTELMYKTAFQQGQLLESLFTVNTSERFNISIGYKGLRSLGKYQHILTSTGNFSFTTNYKTKNERYYFRGHIVMQDVFQEENGGLQSDDLVNFESGDPEFIDRSVFDPLFQNADGEVREKRYHLEHSYNIVHQQDSIRTNFLKIGNVVTFQDKFYEFNQASVNSVFGEAFTTSIFDKVSLEDFYAEANLEFINKDVGRLKTLIGYRDYNYGYNKLVTINNNDITNRLKGNVISAGAEYNNNIGKFNLDAKAGINVAGDFDGNFIDAVASYSIKEDIDVRAGLNINSKAPNYGYLLYQSDYLNYNWQNNFENVQTKQLNFSLRSSKLLNLDLDYTTLNNYVYYTTGIDDKIVSPVQTNNTINYFRIKIQKELKFGKFALNNTVRYQNVLDGEGELNLPEIVTRNTLYFSSQFFKKALFLQTGITFNYFTEYNMNAYDPVLGEFYVQNNTKVGGYPRLDFFINAKVRQTRIYLKAEHFNASFTGYDYYSAPNYPFRDFTVRFGLVWNFFL